MIGVPGQKLSLTESADYSFLLVQEGFQEGRIYPFRILSISLLIHKLTSEPRVIKFAKIYEYMNYVVKIVQKYGSKITSQMQPRHQ